MSFGHLPGAFLEIFFSFHKATLGSRLPLNHPPAPCAAFIPFMAPLAAKQHVLWPPAGRFPGDFLLVSESTVMQYRLALNPPRRPKLPLNPSWRPWRPSSMSFGHLPGAFLEIFFSFQKATLGSRLPLNAPRRPELPLNPSWRPWRPSSMSFGHLPGAFLEIFFSFQTATLGSRLALNPPWRPELPFNASWRPWRPSSMCFRKQHYTVGWPYTLPGALSCL